MKFYEFFRDASTLSIPKQLCRVMRITAFILLAFLIQVSASSKAQISLNLKQQSMRKALKDLSKQSGYDFIYADQDISLAKPISLNLNNVSLEKALQLCFADQPLVYEVSDKTVM
ncbi:MAG TPA: STN domain-containing protein, partial [Pedobacter sp.]|nr:STN domain-containing protein [Pedobacter sp.]